MQKLSGGPLLTAAQVPLRLQDLLMPGTSSATGTGGRRGRPRSDIARRGGDGGRQGHAFPTGSPSSSGCDGGRITHFRTYMAALGIRWASFAAQHYDMIQIPNWVIISACLRKSDHHENT
ncbi:hypothetical protein LY78DRAFT_156270 [Colletotrichum sublineola]|nr:hypothetical protein LY78DRAFT_156270 [Colletotrichum sublineola]